MSKRGGGHKKGGGPRDRGPRDVGVPANPPPPSSPLAAFWELLDLRAKASILQVKLAALPSVRLCASCKRLLKAAWAPNGADLRTVDDAYDIPWGYTLMRLQDGSYVTDDTRTPLSPHKVLEFAMPPPPDLYSTAAAGSGAGGGGGAAADRAFVYRGPADGEVFRYVGRIPDVPPGACWYCHDKIYVRFVDMLTYPRPPRRFTMLLCRDDRVRALKQVLAAEVGLESPGRLVLQLGGATLDDDNASMQSLGLANGQLVIITKSPAGAGAPRPPQLQLVAGPAAPPAALADAAAAVGVAGGRGGAATEGRALDLPPPAPLPTGDAASAAAAAAPAPGDGVPDGAGAAVALRAAVNGRPPPSDRGEVDGDGVTPPPLPPPPDAAGEPGAGAIVLVGDGGAARRRPDADPAPPPPPPGAALESVQQNKSFVAQLLLGATGFGGGGSGGGDKFPGIPTNESPPVSPRGPVASVDRRHGYSVLGCLLSHLLHAEISAAWEADISAMRAQEALIAECESERLVSVRGEGGRCGGAALHPCTPRLAAAAAAAARGQEGGQDEGRRSSERGPGAGRRACCAKGWGSSSRGPARTARSPAGE